MEVRMGVCLFVKHHGFTEYLQMILGSIKRDGAPVCLMINPRYRKR